jgi:hypothetical protein
MTVVRTTTMGLTAAELDLLDDALSYYRASDMGGGDRDNHDDRRTMRTLQRRVDAARTRVGRDVDAELGIS